MTTAANPSAVGHKAASGHAGPVSRTHGAAAGPTDGAGAGGGFLAILGAVDDASAEPLGDTAGIGVPAWAAVGSDAPAALASVAFDAATLLQQNPQIAAAQAMQVTDTGLATAATSLAANAAAAVGDASLVSAALAGRVQPQPADAALAAATASAPRGSQPADAPGKPTATARSAANLVAPATSALPDQAESNTQGLQQAFARVRAGTDALQSAALSSTVGTGNTLATAADTKQGIAAMEQAKALSGSNTPAQVLAPLPATIEKSQAERERSGTDLKRAEPTYSGTTLGFSLPDGSQSGAAAPVLAPEMQVAEQVSYWVSHNVQNAELSLDGLGNSPVQVSISLQGNEAQISFRTDEAAAREVLQNAGAHLKEMLQSEGLVLTGVSVGHAGSGNADGSERRPRQNVRQTAIAPLQASGAESRPGPRAASTGSAGRSVDLFV
jgi:flagellar hook-length control protein FliK